jgi:hypothetical protein
MPSGQKAHRAHPDGEGCKNQKLENQVKLPDPKYKVSGFGD